MPREDKKTEMSKWLNNKNPLVFNVTFDAFSFKVLVFCDDVELALEQVKFKYRNLTNAEVKCEGKVNHFIL